MGAEDKMLFKREGKSFDKNSSTKIGRFFIFTGAGMH